jgi:hypothetical protein
MLGLRRVNPGDLGADVPVRLVMLALLVATVTGCGGTSAKPHRIVVGAVEDAAKSGDSGEKMALARKAGFRAIALSAVWTPPLEAPPDAELTRLRTAVEAARAAGIRPIVAVYSFAAATPVTPEARAQFAAYAAAIVRALPAVRDVSVGNEPNLNLFWMPQFGPNGEDVAATAYLALLAETYDALKAVSPAVNVIGGSLSARGSDRPAGSRPTHSPTRFIEDLGAAFRALGRDRPVMDMFALHPYPESSAIPADFEHPNSTAIGLADYDKLVGLLGDAFDGTAQPGSKLPIVYGEYGLQTAIPPAKQTAYTGLEQPTTKPIDEETQAREYAKAIAIAACSPTVRMLLFFHVTDEPQLERLQTGVAYADDTPKASFEPVAKAARDARAARTQCP